MSIAGLLLTPGAGTSADHPSLVSLADALQPLPVRRVDFPYRKEGRKAPDRAPKLIASVVDDTDQFAAELGVDTSQLVIGGRSMGGRMCSMTAAEGLAVAGLVLIAYPLHPAGKPEKLRVDHFPQVAVPTLFVSGTTDAFGRPDEFAEHVSSIGGPVTQVWIEGKGHPLKGADDQVAAAVREWLDETFS